MIQQYTFLFVVAFFWGFLICYHLIIRASWFEFVPLAILTLVISAIFGIISPTASVACAVLLQLGFIGYILFPKSRRKCKRPTKRP
jgi:hypothetical protein